MALSSGGRKLLFGKLFYGLRQAGVKVTPREWLTLCEALLSGAVEPTLDALYVVGRACLIKHEAHFDTWDQCFAATFGNASMPVSLRDELLEWLENPIEPRALSAEEQAELDKLSLDELRRKFLERLEEQTERHDGGNHWVGTGGTSAFGNSGKNPAGIRVGGNSGGKSAVQVAQMRRYADYRSDRVLDTRSMAVALRRLRKLSRQEGEPELDIDGTIEKTGKNAGELDLNFIPPRENQARVVLLMDVGGSMTPYSRLVETLFSAASTQNHWRKFESFYFHNCVYSRLFSSMTRGETEPTADVLLSRPPETFFIYVGDASMAPSELLSANGAIDFFERSQTPGLVWLHRLRTQFPRSVWLNPMRPEHWRGYTTELIARLFPMFPLSVDGLTQAVEHLVGRVPPPPPAPLNPRILTD